MYLKDCQYAYEKVELLLCYNNTPCVFRKLVLKLVSFEHLIPKGRFLGWDCGFFGTDLVRKREEMG